MAPKKAGKAKSGAKTEPAAKAAAKPANTNGKAAAGVKKDIKKKDDKKKKSGGGDRGTFVAADFAIDESARHTGKCIFFRNSNGFGFIEPEEKPEGVTKVMVHWKEIQTSDRWPSLTKDLEVEFNIRKVEKKDGKFELQAAQVTLPGGGQITVEEALEAGLEFVGERNMRFLGDVKFYNPGKGFGFIHLQEGYDIDEAIPTDLYVPREQITSVEGETPWLGPKMEVEFGIYKDAKGYGCFNVTLPGGEPVVRPPKKEKAAEEEKKA